MEYYCYLIKYEGVARCSSALAARSGAPPARTCEEGGVLGEVCRKRRQTVRREGVAGGAMALGKTPAQIMLNWLISQPQVIAIPKTDRVERVDEAVGSIGWTMSPEERAALANS